MTHVTGDNRSPGRARRAGRKALRWLPDVLDIVIDALTGWW